MNLVKTKFNFPDASLLRKTKTNKNFWQESLPANLTILGWLMVFVMGEDVIQHCPQISGDSLDTLRPSQLPCPHNYYSLVIPIYDNPCCFLSDAPK